MEKNPKKKLEKTDRIHLTWPYKKSFIYQENDGEPHEHTQEAIPDHPPLLTDFAHYSPEGRQSLTQIGPDDNWLIKGDNLQVLHGLRRPFAAAIKLIYIDPPYNTGKDTFGYQDNFSHASWLGFMQSRLTACRALLRKDGSIWISIDDDEAHYLKVLCDEIFGRENFVANVVWQKKFSPQNDAKWFSDNHDHILVYARDKAIWRPNLLPRTESMNRRYQNPDHDPRGPWTSGDLSVKTYNPNCDYPIATPSGRIVHPPKGSCWRISSQKLEELMEDNRIWFGKNGDNVPRLKRFLSEVKKGQVPQTLWFHEEVGHNQEARQETNKLLGDEVFRTPKPERLLHQILKIGSLPGDLVLDFFAGSGTTGAVALKTGRRFIMCEQMDYALPITTKRLQAVIKGEQGGISQKVAWSGGGTFNFAEMATIEKLFPPEKLQQLEGQQLGELLEKMTELLQMAGKSSLVPNKSNFACFSLKEQRTLLVHQLSLHGFQLLLPEMDDPLWSISNEEKRLNQQFYQHPT